MKHLGKSRVLQQEAQSRHTAPLRAGGAQVQSCPVLCETYLSGLSEKGILTLVWGRAPTGTTTARRWLRRELP